MTPTPLPTVILEQIEAAALALKQGELVAYPTETVYGLGADPGRGAALEKLLRLKGREATKGLILLVAGAAEVERVALPPSPLARALMARFWPGPLTLVIPARPELSPLVTGGHGWVAVRHSPSPVVTTLLERFGAPLVSTSANPSGVPTPARGEELRRLWGKALAVVVDHPGNGGGGQPSTVIRVDGERLEGLREGAIPFEGLVRAVTYSGRRGG